MQKNTKHHIILYSKKPEDLEMENQQNIDKRNDKIL